MNREKVGGGGHKLIDIISTLSMSMVKINFLTVIIVYTYYG